VLVPRRKFLERSAAAAGALWRFAEAWAQATRPSGFAEGRLIKTVPLGRFDDRPQPPLDTLLGRGLDARQFINLSTLSDENLIVSNQRFYVRTSSPPAISHERWVVRLGGHVRDAVDVSLETLRSLARPAGAHLLECAGNTDPANYGLIGAAEWSGVPVGAVLDRVSPLPGPWRVRITGVDHPESSVSSIAGAAWVFSRDDLDRAGAFLATEMNGVALPPDHGQPVRLIVPGWYGCACIKWVSHIDLVPEAAEATTQMHEFARRTHQEGVPALARDFEPARIDLAATPIRVEQWSLGGRIAYRVVGIMWGGERPTNALTIRFKHNQPFVAVEHCPLPASTRTWTLWSHNWRPESPGTYQIVLRASDPSIRTRRLDLFAYTRDVRIDEV
jgi:DMSO/TMAO reductase YedYZ molybdopterin-dependent catalytic subunit